MKKLLALGALSLSLGLVALCVMSSNRAAGNPHAASRPALGSPVTGRTLEPLTAPAEHPAGARSAESGLPESDSTVLEQLGEHSNIPMGTIIVRLVDGFGAPVSPGIATATTYGSRGISASSPVDTEGMTSLQVPPGSYRITIAAEGLAFGFGVPQRQNHGVRTPRKPGVFAPIVDVADGQEAEVSLTCFKLGTVFGFVVRFDGGPINELRVSLQTTDGARITTETDQKGEFVFDNVLPGQLVIEANSAEVEDVLLHSERMTVQCIEGGAVNVGAIRLDVNGATIRGRLVDLDGLPFGGLPVIAYAEGTSMDKAVGSACSREDGTFEILNVPALRGSVIVNELPLELERWMQPLPVDVPSNSDVVEVGDIVLERSEPYSLTVRIVVNDAKEARRTKLSVSRLLLGKDNPGSERVVRKSTPPDALGESFPMTLTYLWVTKDTSGTADLIFKAGRHKQVVSLDFRPNGTQEVDLQIPREPH